MDDLRQEFGQEEIEDLLNEEFNPDIFYKALTNALAQLESLDQEAA